MLTRAQASNGCQSPPEGRDPPVRPNAQRMRGMVHHSILVMEERIGALEAWDTDQLTRQSVIHISKMLETVCSKFKIYHYENVAALETDEVAMYM